ncbi:DUF2785 domain-containing protein [Tissierella sp. MSJ-40]|uniref:DUF2785 domain-containing protein n=1 Tax=Tissierella simiarum TaxID=2841534 RepID=A0ABS6E9N6_9FIRM|nr:DUF2785 domain-containing protein [Tissierella simiarum]MBU5439642.1 DUF2785 domain-containing protein [Tissierella simiarum]
MDKSYLIQKLRTIKKEEYKLGKGENALELALIMLRYIGDTDSELRDDLIYSVMSNWIVNDVFSVDELYKILGISLDDGHLFYNIGNIDDSVFTRSFSMLIVAAILYAHRKNNFLTKEDLGIVKDKLICYMRKEKDLRGYVDKKGWAHSVAHGSDALDEIAQCTEIDKEDLREILNIIYEKVEVDYYIYIHDEDERMITAVMSILNREMLSESEIISWIVGFRQNLKLGKYSDKNDNIYINIKNFLRGLYFRILKEDKSSKYLYIIQEKLENIKLSTL